MTMRFFSVIYREAVDRPVVPKAPMLKALALAAGLSLGMLSYPVHAATASGGDTVRGLYDALLNTMKNGRTLGQSGRFAKLDPVIRRSFDIAEMARLSLGRSWPGLSDAQRQQMTESYGRYVSAIYADRFDSYAGPGETGQSNIEKAAQFARVVRVLQLAERLGLDLPDSFAGYRELVSDFFQGMAIRSDAEAHAQDALLARRQACEHLVGGLTKIGLDRGIEWRYRFLVLDEVAQAAVLLLANRHIKAERLLGDTQHLAHPFERHRQLFGKLFGGRLAADLVQHLSRRSSQLLDRLDHVYRDADRARLVVDRAGDSLPDPPGGVGRELVTAPVFEFVDRLH